jgi:glycerol-1-phosphate dehydrogenase [NAD(P)+]
MMEHVRRILGDCGCGRIHSLDLDSVYVESGALKRLDGVLSKFQKPFIVCDENTRDAVMPAMEQSFIKYGSVTLPRRDVVADNAAVDLVLGLTKGSSDSFAALTVKEAAPCDVLVAVGSGTITDLVRFCAGTLGIPFISVPTAASVDGFTSTVCAMTWHGVKRTFYMPPPVAVLADTDIFAAAPYRLTASGVSDIMGKYTALADWKIAHLLDGEYYCEAIVGLIKMLLDETEKVLARMRPDTPVTTEDAEIIMNALIISGLAMQIAGTSRPASGAEHHISHLLEMNVINDKLDALHGEKVSVGLLMTLWYYDFWRRAFCYEKFQFVENYDFETDELMDIFGEKGLYDMIIEINGENLLTPVVYSNFREKFWDIVGILTKLPNADDVKARLDAAGCVTTMEQIGVSREWHDCLLVISPYVGRKLTFMRALKLVKLI